MNIKRNIPHAFALLILLLWEMIPGCSADQQCTKQIVPVSDLKQAAEKIATALEERLDCGLYLVLPEGEFIGTLDLPGGVHLMGQGPVKTFILEPENTKSEGVLTLNPSNGRSAGIDALSIKTDGMHGIHAHGPGSVSISNVIVEVIGSKENGGIGLVLKELTNFSVTNSRATGGVTESNAGGIGQSNIGSYGLQGLQVQNCLNGELIDFSLNGFAWMGASFDGGGSFSWSGQEGKSVVSKMLRAGVVVRGQAELSASSLEIESIWQGTFSDVGFGAVVYGGGRFDSVSLAISNTKYIGLLAQDTDVDAVGLKVSETLIGVWVQASDTGVDGANLNLTDVNISEVKGIAIGGYGLDTFSISGGIRNVSSILRHSHS